MFLILLILGIASAHIILEVAGRYHYSAISIFSLFASFGLINTHRAFAHLRLPLNINQRTVSKYALSKTQQISVLFLTLIISISLISASTVFTTKTYAQEITTSGFVGPQSTLYYDSEFIGKYAIQVNNGKLILYRSKNSEINDIIVKKKIIYYAMNKNNVIKICKYDTVSCKNLVAKNYGYH